jgi:hypothetical protein
MLVEGAAIKQGCTHRPHDGNGPRTFAAAHHPAGFRWLPVVEENVGGREDIDAEAVVLTRRGIKTQDVDGRGEVRCDALAPPPEPS